MWETDKLLRLSVDGVRLEGRCWGPPPDKSPTLVLLHEGLGCVSLWRDFPALLAAASGFGVFAYSRQGYGQSDAAVLPRPVDYMTDEAVQVLPKVLDGIGFQTGFLIGHSDGASIAAIYAGSLDDSRLSGLCLLAPHFFTEPGGLASIADAKVAYETTDLKTRLGRYHADPQNAFRGWNDAWLSPEFASWNIEFVIAQICVPVLAIQGENDQYGSAAQLDALAAKLKSDFRRLDLPDCQHSPQFEKSKETVAAIQRFVQYNAEKMEK